MRIYLAGKWQEAEKIAQYAKVLESLGYTITCPWFSKHVGADISREQGALDDTDGVVTADVAIFIFENKLPYAGAYSELGMALGLLVATDLPMFRVMVVGDAGKENIFTHHPAVEHFESFGEAVKSLVIDQYKTDALNERLEEMIAAA